MIEYYEGSEQWFEGRVFPDTDRLVVLFRDVTESKQAEIRLRRNLEGAAAAEQIIGFGIWSWDIVDDKVTWSDELHRIYGLGPANSRAPPGLRERIHPDDRERVWAEITHSMETLDPFVFRERIVRPDGSERVLLSQGRVIAAPDGSAESLVGVCHDLTDRAAVENALGASERRMRAIVDSTPSLISVKDLEGNYLMCNAEFERVLGRPGAEIVGHRCLDLFPPEIAEAGSAPPTSARRARGSGRRRDGTDQRRRAAYLHDLDLRPARRGASGRDLHDRHRRHRAPRGRESSPRATEWTGESPRPSRRAG